MIEELTIEASFDFKQIDKSGWQTYRFDQIAFNISERVEPQETDLDIYVGLEHLDPESIHIKRWGTPSDVEGTKLKVYPGDVIFGKRRAYQRKAALATFEGICSAHAMVLRPNPEVIEPNLFLFFLHSDAFMHRAVDISVGSLSPTINWKTLAVQEFLLPPKEQQAKLAELLWAADEVVEKNIIKQEVIKGVKGAYLRNKFRNGNGRTEPVGDYIKLSSGKERPKDIKPEVIDDYKYPVYGGNGIIGYSSKPLISHETIVIGRVGEYCGCVYHLNEPAWISDNALYITEFRKPIDIVYLKTYLEYLDLNRLQNRSSHPLITQSKVYDCMIDVPDEFEIDKIVKQLKFIEENQELQRNHLSIARIVKNDLVNQIFS